MAKIHDLPEEIIVKIFSYLFQSHLQHSVGNVCQKWRRISHDKSLYQHLYLDEKLSLHRAVEILMRYAAFIQKLTINRRQDSDELLNVIPFCENLQSLVINSCSGSSYPHGRISLELNSKLLTTILEKNYNLSHLRITHSTIRNGCINIVGHNLEELILKNAYYHRTIEENGILLHNKLKVLNLQGVIINKTSLFKIILNNRYTLHTLKLDVWEPQHGSNGDIIKATSTCLNLRKLLLKNVSFYCISKDSFQRLAQLKKLTTIVFSNIEKITPQTFVQLFRQPNSIYLKKIILSTCNGVNGSFLKVMSENCPNLKKFGIHQSKTAEINLIYADDILYLVSRCTKLEMLDLCYTHHSIGKSIPKIISYLPSLQKFKYCDYLNCNSKVLLTSIYNILNRNVEQFRLKIELNSDLDEYISGTRILDNRR